MCLSAEASFTAGTALLVAGGYCVREACRKSWRHLPLAAIPLFFGVQQIGEGFVWIGLLRNDAALLRAASLWFLFFALAFWPFWVAFTGCFLETHSGRRWLPIGFTALGVVWFAVLYLPLLFDPELLRVRAVHHSVQYNYDGLPIYQHVSPPLLRVLYLVTVGVPFLLYADRGPRVFGLLFGGAAVFSHFVFPHAFVSVWCFMAAILALYLCAILHNLPVGSASSARPHSPVPLT
jgi:hypothetical protein